MKFRLICSSIIFLVALQVICAQSIIGIGTRWSDSFKEWIVHTENEDNTGTLELRWTFQDDWSVWDFRLGDTTASMSLKWRDDPNLWEIQCLNVTATARTSWTGDFRRWRISDGSHTFIWESKFGNIFNEWILADERYGHFTVYTYWEDDPREWVVTDELSEDVSFTMRLALLFIAIQHSTPKL